MEFFAVLIVFIIILIVIRVYIRHRIGGGYIEILQVPSRGFMLPESLRKTLEEANIRYRTVRKGGVNMPFAPLAGPQFIGLEVHGEDLERGRRIVSAHQGKQMKNRFKD